MSHPLDPTENLTPPSGDSQKAEKYVEKLVDLLDENKITVIHTDLSKFDPSSLDDHYRLDVKDYSIEISHSKNANSGKDSYVMVFNNLKRLTDSCDKVILAYMHLDPNQFIRFKNAADDQLERIRKAEEERRFKEAMTPIDQALEEIAEKEENKPQTEYIASQPQTNSNGVDNLSYNTNGLDHKYTSFLD